MSLKSLARAASNRVGRQVLTLRKHSPAILFGAGVVGFGTTVVLACRATIKLEALLEKTQDALHTIRTAEHAEYTDEDRRRDQAIIYGQTTMKLVKLYGPAALVGIASIGALTGSHVVLAKRNVALTAAYAVLDQGFRQYRERVVEEFGPEKDRELRYGLEEIEVVEKDKDGKDKVVKKTGPKGLSVYARFFDECSVNWNREHSYNQLFLQCQQNYANDLLKARGHVFLNEVYDMLGLERSSEGAVVGWVRGNGDDYIDFGVFEGDREMGMRFVRGEERSILLDFNVDGVIYDKI